MGQSYSERVKSAQLTDQERRIAETIDCTLSKAAFLPGPQLAKTCGVSVSAITRFAQKLGYSGFPELKQELEETFRRTITPYEMFKEFLSGSRNPTIAQDSIAQDLQNIMIMQRLLDEEALKRAIDAIDAARKVFSVAISGSGVAVQLFELYMNVLGKPHQGLVGHGVSKQLEVADLQAGDALIAVCTQRIFREVRDSALFAKRRGASTIAITDSATNALAAVCDHVLISPVSGATFGYSHVAPVAMVNVIVNGLAAKSPEKSLKELQRIKNRWSTTDVFCSSDIHDEDVESKDRR